MFEEGTSNDVKIGYLRALKPYKDVEVVDKSQADLQIAVQAYQIEDRGRARCSRVGCSQTLQGMGSGGLRRL